MPPKQAPDQVYQHRPNSFPWPPVLYLAATATGLLLHWMTPVPWPGQPFAVAATLLGTGLICSALAIELATVLTFRKHQTTVLPHRGATNLITTGPFAWSRNPIYLANTMLVGGAGLAFGIAWLLPAAALAALLTRQLAIRREEHHLAARFGAGWQAYAARTNRWFGRAVKQSGNHPY